MRKTRYLIVIAAFALLSAALAGSALPAASQQGATAAQHNAKKPSQQAAKPKPKKPAKKKTTTTKTTTTAASSLAFTGTYSGQASSKVSGTTANLSATGTGTSNLIGAGSITGTGTADTSVQPCPPFGGTGTITGAQGNITFSVVNGANGCGDDGGHNFALVGYLQVVKATGALAGDTGQLRFTGSYSRDDGTFSLKLSGTLKK